MNGQGSLGLIKNIFPINFRPEIYAFYVGYISGVNGEKFGCGICLTKLNSTTGSNDTILNIMGMMPANGGQIIPWTKISAILESSYLSNEVPDQATIYFITDVAMNPNGTIIASPNTFLALDNIHFEEEGANNIEGFTMTNIESLSNYPNPFNEATTIHYELLNKTHVNLTIYDINGKEVINLVNKEQGRGEHAVVLSAVDLMKGIYVYKLQTDGYVRSAKMIVR